MVGGGGGRNLSKSTKDSPYRVFALRSKFLLKQLFLFTFLSYASGRNKKQENIEIPLLLFSMSNRKVREPPF